MINLQNALNMEHHALIWFGHLSELAALCVTICVTLLIAAILGSFMGYGVWRLRIRQTTDTNNQTGCEDGTRDLQSVCENDIWPPPPSAQFLQAPPKHETRKVQEVDLAE